MYRTYVTDVLMGLSGAKVRFADLIKTDDSPVREPEEIVDEITSEIMKMKGETHADD